jgi:hypothetical protein
MHGWALVVINAVEVEYPKDLCTHIWYVSVLLCYNEVVK